jgi:hypothetical protein
MVSINGITFISTTAWNAAGDDTTYVTVLGVPSSV